MDHVRSALLDQLAEGRGQRHRGGRVHVADREPGVAVPGSAGEHPDGVPAVREGPPEAP